MLVLSRKKSQAVTIGTDVTITVTEVAKGRVTLGIDAPKETKILRGELEPNEMDLASPRRQLERQTNELR